MISKEKSKSTLLYSRCCWRLALVTVSVSVQVSVEEDYYYSFFRQDRRQNRSSEEEWECANIGQTIRHFSHRQIRWFCKFPRVERKIPRFQVLPRVNDPVFVCLLQRKTTDIASRLRKEPEICLSPQRKSFNTGCSVQNAKLESSGGAEISNGNTNINLGKQTLPKFVFIYLTR